MTSRREFLAAAMTFIIFRSKLARAIPVLRAPKPGRESVLVIGAGISGIAAARALHDSGYEVVILEARDRIGGRIHSADVGGATLELGAAWIHGIEKNPVFELSKELGLKTIVTDRERTETFTQDGSRYSESDREKMDKTFTALLETAEQRKSALRKDQSLEALFLELMEEAGFSKKEIQEQLHLIQTDVENEYAADSSALSAKHWEELDDFDGEEVILPDGYGLLLERLATGLTIKLNKLVKEIHHTKSGVKVTLVNGEEFHASKCVVTLPLGVLKAGEVKFLPELPDFKRKAISRLGMGVFNKVFVEFPFAFWGTEKTWIEMLSEKPTEWPMFFNMARFTGKPILAALTAGSFAEQMEQKSDEQIRQELRACLTRCFGEIPAPVRITVTRWKADPYSRGAYSYLALGSSPADLDRLGDPVGESLFFAGEATSSFRESTVHAAYLSGLRAAEQVSGGV